MTDDRVFKQADKLVKIELSVLRLATMRSKMGNYEVIASQFLRALRGKRSQRSLARRLGYKANPITDWENARRFPTAEEALRAARLLGVDVSTAFKQFHPPAPAIMAGNAFKVAAWLDNVRGEASLLMLAERARVSRFAVGRWCRDQAKPRLPDFFRLVDAATDRLPDLVALLVAIETVPGLLSRYDAAEAARSAAYTAPWTEAVLRAICSTSYNQLPKHRPGFIAELLGISAIDEQRSLTLLRRAGAIYKNRGRYRIRDTTSVDTHGDRDRVTALLEHWNSVAYERVCKRRSGRDYFAYNVCSLSVEDYERIRGILTRAFHEIRSIVAVSEPDERIALLNLQLVDLMVQ